MKVSTVPTLIFRTFFQNFSQELFSQQSVTLLPISMTSLSIIEKIFSYKVRSLLRSLPWQKLEIFQSCYKKILIRKQMKRRGNEIWGLIILLFLGVALALFLLTPGKSSLRIILVPKVFRKLKQFEGQLINQPIKFCSYMTLLKNHMPHKLCDITRDSHVSQMLKKKFLITNFKMSSGQEKFLFYMVSILKF